MSTFEIKNGTGFTDQIVLYPSGSIKSSGSTVGTGSIGVGSSATANTNSIAVGINVSAATNSIAVGESNIASGDESIAIGQGNIAYGLGSFVGGYAANASTTNNAVSGTSSFSFQDGYLGTYGIRPGVYSNKSVILGGRENLIVSQIESAIVSSIFSRISGATGANSTILGGNSNFVNAQYGTVINSDGASSYGNLAGVINSFGSTANGTNVLILNDATSKNITENNTTYIGGIRRGGYVLSQTWASSTANTSNTVYITIGSFTAVAGAVYRVRLVGTFQTAATTTGIKVRGGGTCTGNFVGYMQGQLSQLATATGLRIQTNVINAELITTGVSNINTPHAIEGEIIFICTAGGSYRLEFASEVNASSCQINAGTTMLVERIDQ
jgi:hypothetical protein